MSITKQVVLNVFSDVERPDGYAVAVITLDLSGARRLLGLMDLAAGLKTLNPEIVELRAQSYEAAYYAEGDEPEEEGQPNGAAQETEYDCVLVSDDSMNWTAYPDHCDVRMYTDNLYRSVVEALVRELEKAEHAVRDQPRDPLPPSATEILHEMLDYLDSHPDHTHSINELIDATGFTAKATAALAQEVG